MSGITAPLRWSRFDLAEPAPPATGLAMVVGATRASSSPSSRSSRSLR